MLEDQIKRRVLFVDDDPLLLESFCTAMRKEPFTVVTALSGNEGLAALEQQHIDVVVSDQQMPGMTGADFLEAVAHRYPHTVRIMLTGNASLDLAIRAINKGQIYRFFTKPCNPVALAYTIRHALQVRELARATTQLLARAKAQHALLIDLEQEHPGITEVDWAPGGRIMIDETDTDIDELISEIHLELERAESVNKPG